MITGVMDAHALLVRMLVLGLDVGFEVHARGALVRQVGAHVPLLVVHSLQHRWVKVPILGHILEALQGHEAQKPCKRHNQKLSHFLAASRTLKVRKWSGWCLRGWPRQPPWVPCARCASRRG